MKFLLSLLTFGTVATASFFIPPHGVQITHHQPGEIFMWGGASCPNGSQALNGTSLLRAGTYAKLFAVVGTVYGSVDGSHFTLPNTSGVFVRGAGSQIYNSITYTGTPGTEQNDQFKSHTHVLANTDNGNNGTPTLAAGQYLPYQNTSAFEVGYGFGGTATLPSVGQVAFTGGSETNPANIVLLYCIVY